MGSAYGIVSAAANASATGLDVWLFISLNLQMFELPQRQQRSAHALLTVQRIQGALDQRRACRRRSNRARALWWCLPGRLGYSRGQGDERRCVEIGSRNECFLLIVQDCNTGNAIVLMVIRTEFIRVGNGKCLSGQKQRYGELRHPVVLSDSRHGAILHVLGFASTRLPSLQTGKRPLAQV